MHSNNLPSFLNSLSINPCLGLHRIAGPDSFKVAIDGAPSMYNVTYYTASSIN